MTRAKMTYSVVACSDKARAKTICSVVAFFYDEGSDNLFGCGLLL